MTSTVYEIGGVRYLKSGRVATLLGIDQRTVLRWVQRAQKGRCPLVLQRLQWKRDPVNGFTYFTEKSVLEIRKELSGSRPFRRV